MTELWMKVRGVDLLVEGTYVGNPAGFDESYFEWERVQVADVDKGVYIDITSLLIALDVDTFDNLVQNHAFKQQVEEE